MKGNNLTAASTSIDCSLSLSLDMSRTCIAHSPSPPLSHTPTHPHTFFSSRCNEDNGCCTEFEACVSCCLDPRHETAALLPSTTKVPGHPETGTFSNPFDLCVGLCHTHLSYTEHENAYISPRHHCYLPNRRPWELHETKVAALPPGTEVRAGSPGNSCTSTCSSNGFACVGGAGAAGAALNQCHVLREHFACEAGCDEAVSRWLWMCLVVPATLESCQSNMRPSSHHACSPMTARGRPAHGLHSLSIG